MAESGHEQLLPPRANMFFAIYFVMTGLHAVHVIIGMSILTWVLVKNMRGTPAARPPRPRVLGIRCAEATKMSS